MLEIDPKTPMVKNFLDKSSEDFAAGGLTGLFLKAIISNTVFFNGALILSNDFGEIVVDPPTPTSVPRNKNWD